MATFFKYTLPERKYTSKIRNCFACPFCYDMIGCMATDDIDDRVRVNDETIPEFCPLKYEGIEEVLVDE